MGFNLGLPRQYRVRKSWQYHRIKQIGKRIYSPSFVLQVAPSTDAFSRVGFIVTKKVGNAVVRNRVKRLLREVFRNNAQWIQEKVEIVCIVKRSAGAIGFLEADKEIKAVQSKFTKAYCQQTPQANNLSTS